MFYLPSPKQKSSGLSVFIGYNVLAVLQFLTSRRTMTLKKKLALMLILPFYWFHTPLLSARFNFQSYKKAFSGCSMH